MQNSEYNAIFKFVSTGMLPTNFSSNKSNFLRKARRFNVKNGVLYKGNLAVVKFSDQKKIFNSMPGFTNLFIILLEKVL